MIVLSRSKGTERLQDLCLNWYKQTNSLRMASLVCKGRHCGSPEIQHQLLSATSQDPTWKITFLRKYFHTIALCCVILSTTFRHIAKHCCKNQGKCQLDFFCILHCQCHNVRLSIFTMSKCHNVTIFTMSQYSQYLNVTLFTIYQCHKVKILHNVSMSQCHNVTLFTISRCHNEQSTHLAPHSAMTKPAAKVTSRCNTVETGDLFASLGCMGKM